MFFQADMEWYEMVNTREIAAEYRLSHWAQIMQERTQSGLSIRAFCREAGISNNTYFYWQKKLRSAACAELAAVAQAGTLDSGKALTPSGWAMCGTTTDMSEKKTLTVEIGNCRILVEQNSDLELLTKVCRTLRSVC